MWKSERICYCTVAPNIIRTVVPTKHNPQNIITYRSPILLKRIVLSGKLRLFRIRKKLTCNDFNFRNNVVKCFDTRSHLPMGSKRKGEETANNEGEAHTTIIHSYVVRAVWFEKLFHLQNCWWKMQTSDWLGKVARARYHTEKLTPAKPKQRQGCPRPANISAESSRKHDIIQAHNSWTDHARNVRSFAKWVPLEKLKIINYMSIRRKDSANLYQLRTTRRRANTLFTSASDIGTYWHTASRQ